MSEPHIVEAGQVYESCQPTSVIDGEPVHTGIRVVGAPADQWLRGYSKVQVVTLTEDGRRARERALATSQLHAAAVTAAGRERRTGTGSSPSPTRQGPTMHDPLVVAFEFHRPWPHRSRPRTLGGTPLPASWHWPSIVTVWHREPGGHDALTICRKRTQRPDGKWSRSWVLHVHHWKVQVLPLQRLRRRLLTRCAWCGGRSRKCDVVNVRRGWDSPRVRWWQGERGLHHMDCSAIASAHRTCLCADPVFEYEGWGSCARCGKRRSYGCSVEALERMRELAQVPVGQRREARS